MIQIIVYCGSPTINVVSHGMEVEITRVEVEAL